MSFVLSVVIGSVLAMVWPWETNWEVVVLKRNQLELVHEEI